MRRRRLQRAGAALAAAGGGMARPRALARWGRGGRRGGRRELRRRPLRGRPVPDKAAAALRPGDRGGGSGGRRRRRRRAGSRWAGGCWSRPGWGPSPPGGGIGGVGGGAARRPRRAPRAATFTQSYSTSLSRCATGRAQPGETVLVLGAGGGVGLAAIGVARALGCRVLGVASSAEKREAARAAGAEAVLDPATEAVKDTARAWAGGTGVDVVVDPIGGELAEPSLRALGDRGRYLVIGFASGAIPSVPLNQVLLRNRTVIGIDWGIWAMQHAADQPRIAGRPAGAGGGGVDCPGAPDRIPARRGGPGAGGPAGPPHGGEDRAGALNPGTRPRWPVPALT